MAKKFKDDSPVDAAVPVKEPGADRVLAPGTETGVKVPGPRIPKVSAPAKAEAPKKSPDKNRVVPLRAKFALNNENVRLNRLRQIARHDRNVAWLLAEYERLTAK